MANMTFLERNKIEKLFGMGTGYVLDFSNQTFQIFISEAVDFDIYDPKYAYRSCSKANRLRAFFDKEPNYIVGKLLSAMLEYCKDIAAEQTPALYQDCVRITRRLLHNAPVQEIEAITPNSGGRDFESLCKSIRESIAKNEPESRSATHVYC